MFRRGLAGHGHGRLAGSGITGGAVDLRLLRFGDGTFTRGGEASYQTGASTLAWADANVLRWEDRGDGNGAVPLFEGGSENLLPNPEAIDLWSSSTATATAGSIVAPDGDADADIITFAAASNSRVFQEVSSAADVDLALSAWGKSAPGLAGSLVLVNKSGAYGAGRVALAVHGTEWERATSVSNSGTGAGNVQFRIENNPSSAVRTIHAWGVQMEPLPFASSYIRNGAARPADVLSFDASEVPEAIRTGRWEFDFYPAFASSTSGLTNYVLCGPAIDNCVRMLSDGRLAIRGGNVDRDVLSATYAAHDKVTVRLDMDAGTIAVLVNDVLADSGTFTPADVDFSGDWYVGSNAGLDRFFYGRISEPRVW